MKHFDELLAALDELTAEHRAVILLREVEGLSYEEISHVMQCAKGTVMSRLHYARKKLREMLAGHLDSETPGRIEKIEGKK